MYYVEYEGFMLVNFFVFHIIY